MKICLIVEKWNKNQIRIGTFHIQKVRWKLDRLVEIETFRNFIDRFKFQNVSKLKVKLNFYRQIFTSLSIRVFIFLQLNKAKMKFRSTFILIYPVYFTTDFHQKDRRLNNFLPENKNPLKTQYGTRKIYPKLEQCLSKATKLLEKNSVRLSGKLILYYFYASAIHSLTHTIRVIGCDPLSFQYFQFTTFWRAIFHISLAYSNSVK